jgi:hypothetical protein
MKSIDKTPFFKEVIDSIFGRYFIYDVDIQGNLLATPVFTDTQFYRTPLKSYISKSTGNALLILRDSIVYSCVPERSIIYSIRLDSSFKIKHIDSLSFKDALDKDETVIASNFVQPFQFLQNRFYLPIKSFNKRRRIVEKYSFLEIEKTDGRVHSMQKIKNPPEYTNLLRRSSFSFLYPYNQLYTACFYLSIDRITLLENKTMKPVKEIDFNPYAAYELYDYAQNKDLGYVRHYGKTNEANYLFLFNKKNIIIIKKTKAISINDEVQYEYLVLDQNFKMICFAQIPQKINPYVSFSYKNGFVLMSPNLKTGYYYEIN